MSEKITKKNTEQSVDADSQVNLDSNSSIPVGNPSIFRRILFGIGILVMFLMLGGLMGYLTGRQDRVNFANNIAATTINDQFVRGLVALQKGNCEVAQEHFEYILGKDQNYPGAFEKLQEAIVYCSHTATPTIAPTFTPVPTVSTMAEADLLQEAVNNLENEDWDNLLSALDSLRDKNPEFESIQVDRYYYIAYRNRGVKKIIEQQNLEGGIFDINKAKLFGPIDVQAINVSLWAESYITGASFWEIDWYQAAYYFQQVALSAPNLTDSSGIGAQERFEISVTELEAYVYKRASELNRNNYACQIKDLYASLTYFIPLTDEISPVATSIASECKD
jgi:hypothetical protein